MLSVHQGGIFTKSETAIAYIHKLHTFGSRPGLTRIRALLDACGNPQETLRFVHITGTNGKGSTSAMTESILRHAGYKTGFFTSPYLFDFRERIQINRALLPEDEFTQEIIRLRTIHEDLIAGAEESCTEFEFITALGMILFAKHKCDFVVLEVGMGGADDSTNVISGSECAVITAVSLDHTQYLGETVSAIAQKKSGIIKPFGNVVTSSRQDPIAMEVLLSACGKQKARLRVPDENALKVVHSDFAGSHIVYKDTPLVVPLAGTHQIRNALTALEVVEVLRENGLAVTPNQIAKGLRETVWRGRLETVRKAPLCLVDGAHNAEAMSALCAACDAYLGERTLHVVCGMFADKDYHAAVPLIARRATSFHAVPVPELARSLDPRHTAEAAAEHCKHVVTHAAVADGCRAALDCAGADGVVLVCGSLYLIGEATRQLTIS